MELQDILQIIGLLGVVVGLHVKNQTKMKELEMKIIAIENDITHSEKQDEKIMNKLDAIGSDITDIKIQLQNKADK